MIRNRWPEGYRAAVSITMDNMGEAAEIQRGSWPVDQTIGLHSSVTRALPRMLEILGEFNVRGTYFIEGWNTETYPQAIQAVRINKHEVAFHGWQHESWRSLGPDQERVLIERSLGGFKKLSLEIFGFRPPGGVLTSVTPALLHEFGVRYCSPAGSDAALLNDLVYLPFDWQGIDAYYYSDGFSTLREVKGDSPEPLDPESFARRVLRLLDDVIERGGYTALLFHPFLETDDERISAMRAIIERVVNDDRIWNDRCVEISDWIRRNPDHFKNDPGLDLSSWPRKEEELAEGD